MKIATLIIVLLSCQSVFSQDCSNCPTNLLNNGDFETFDTNCPTLPGFEIGFEAFQSGCVSAWQGTGITPDILSPELLPALTIPGELFTDNNVAAMCYNLGANHIEEVTNDFILLDDADIRYSVDFDYSALCMNDFNFSSFFTSTYAPIHSGSLEVSLVSDNGINNIGNFPMNNSTDYSAAETFANQCLSDIQVNGQNTRLRFRATTPVPNSSPNLICYGLVDNVELSCNLVHHSCELVYQDLGDGTYNLEVINCNPLLSIGSYVWNTGGGPFNGSASLPSPTALNLGQEVCVTLTDSRNCCIELCTYIIDCPGPPQDLETYVIDATLPGRQSLDSWIEPNGPIPLSVNASLVKIMENKRVIVIGDLEIGNYQFVTKDCLFEFTTNASITTKASFRLSGLTLGNSTYQGCGGARWDGIDIRESGNINTFGISTIRDAKVAIDFYTLSSFRLEDTTFENNLVGLEASGSIVSNPIFVQGLSSTGNTFISSGLDIAILVNNAVFNYDDPTSTTFINEYQEAISATSSFVSIDGINVSNTQALSLFERRFGLVCSDMMDLTITNSKFSLNGIAISIRDSDLANIELHDVDIIQSKDQWQPHRWYHNGLNIRSSLFASLNASNLNISESQRSMRIYDSNFNFATFTNSLFDGSALGVSIIESSNIKFTGEPSTNTFKNGVSTEVSVGNCNNLVFENLEINPSSLEGALNAVSLHGGSNISFWDCIIDNSSNNVSSRGIYSTSVQDMTLCGNEFYGKNGVWMNDPTTPTDFYVQNDHHVQNFGTRITANAIGPQEHAGNRWFNNSMGEIIPVDLQDLSRFLINYDNNDNVQGVLDPVRIAPPIAQWFPDWPGSHQANNCSDIDPHNRRRSRSECCMLDYACCIEVWHHYHLTVSSFYS